MLHKHPLGLSGGSNEGMGVRWNYPLRGRKKNLYYVNAQRYFYVAVTWSLWGGKIQEFHLMFIVWKLPLNIVCVSVGAKRQNKPKIYGHDAANIEYEYLLHSLEGCCGYLNVSQEAAFEPISLFLCPPSFTMRPYPFILKDTWLKTYKSSSWAVSVELRPNIYCHAVMQINLCGNFHWKFSLQKIIHAQLFQSYKFSAINTMTTEYWHCFHLLCKIMRLERMSAKLKKILQNIRSSGIDDISWILISRKFSSLSHEEKENSIVVFIIS